MFQKKRLYGAQEAVKDHHPSKAYRPYIFHVNALIAKYGNRE
jgi:hypothetical protein